MHACVLVCFPNFMASDAFPSLSVRPLEKKHMLGCLCVNMCVCARLHACMLVCLHGVVATDAIPQKARSGCLEGVSA
jgi:hypothetical protein